MKYNELPRRFTLLELIIVVAVIGILLSMLLPSLHKSKIIAMKALCLSNTNQVHKILIGNIHNHNGRIYYHKSQNKAQNPWDLPHPMYKELGEPERDLFYCPLREERNRDDRWNFRIWKVTGYSMMWKRQRGIRRSPISYEWVDYPARIESPDENPLVADTVVKVRDKFSTLDDKRKPIYSSHFPEGHRDQNKTYTLRRFTCRSYRTCCRYLCRFTLCKCFDRTASFAGNIKLLAREAILKKAGSRCIPVSVFAMIFLF